MKVYVVTRGQYSDYGIDSIFSTRERAQKYIDTFPDSDCNGIDEWEVDEDLGKVRYVKGGRVLFAVWMLRDGTTERVEMEHHYRYLIHNEESRMHLMDRSRANPPMLKVMHGTVWAKTPEHAVKIANEKRTQMIANGEWGGSE